MAGPRLRAIPDGDDRERLICPDCNFVAYENPKIIVGAVIGTEDGRIVLCRRAIPPRQGYWTIPAGYLELGETVEAGAKREAFEEARARIEIDRPLAIYTIERISQVQILFRARLTDPAIAAGPESSEVALVDWADIPWQQLAFPSVVWVLNEYERRIGQQDFAPTTTPAENTVNLPGWREDQGG